MRFKFEKGSELLQAVQIPFIIVFLLSVAAKFSFKSEVLIFTRFNAFQLYSAVVFAVWYTSRYDFPVSRAIRFTSSYSG